MEFHPPDHGPCRIIFLNGASSSGKSTLAKAMQEALPEPFLHVSSDHLVASGMLPARRDPGGSFAWWQQMRPRFFDGFHRCLPALAAAGNHLTVEHIIESRAWREYLATLRGGLDVFLVGVHCDLAEIDRRERDRGDRRIGEGGSHVETDLIYAFGPYDFEVDTTTAVPSAATASLLAAWRTRTRRRALGHGIAGNWETLFVPYRYRTRRGN
jgi:chloramphenicol 3-O phosphotransferase